MRIILGLRVAAGRTAGTFYGDGDPQVARKCEALTADVHATTS